MKKSFAENLQQNTYWFMYHVGSSLHIWCIGYRNKVLHRIQLYWDRALLVIMLYVLSLQEVMTSWYYIANFFGNIFCCNTKPWKKNTVQTRTAYVFIPKGSAPQPLTIKNLWLKLLRLLLCGKGQFNHQYIRKMSSHLLCDCTHPQKATLG